MADFIIENKDGFHIYGWMKTDLNLEGADLLAFAMVYSYVKGGAGLYYGNTAYLSAWTGWSQRCSRQHLANLTEMGLLEELRGYESNKPYCRYKLGKTFYSTMKNLQGHYEKFAGSTMKNLQGRIEYIDKNKESKDKSLLIPPTPVEIVEYCRERGWSDPEGFAAHFIDYYTQAKWHLSNGKPMKDWRKAVITWEPNNKWRKFTTPAPKAPAPRHGGSALEQMLELGQEMGFIENNTPDYEQQY